MEHLTPETLARLVDEAPFPAERRHLDACAGCARELAFYRDQTAALSGLPAVRPPRGDWEALEARLLSEGLVDASSRAPALAVTPWWMRAAAALLLFVGGTAAGATWALRGGADTGPVAFLRGTSPEGPPAGRLAAAPAVDLGEAAERVRAAERAYVEALVGYRQLLEASDGAASGDPATRLAALEFLVSAGQAALREAPADPFVNGLLASALAERQAVLRRISTASRDNWF